MNVGQPPLFQTDSHLVPPPWALYSAMSGAKLRLTCLVWPDDNPDEHLVEIKIDDDETVMFLKKLIKDEHAHSLAHVDARDLILLKCSIPADDNLWKTLKTIHFDIPDTRLHRLPPASLLSKHFATGLSPETIHILVEVPAHGECGTHISCSTTEAEMLLTENEAPLLSLPNLLRERQQFNAELPETAPSDSKFDWNMAEDTATPPTWPKRLSEADL